jgi:hypothetical protein
MPEHRRAKAQERENGLAAGLKPRLLSRSTFQLAAMPQAKGLQVKEQTP